MALPGSDDPVSISHDEARQGALRARPEQGRHGGLRGDRDRARHHRRRDAVDSIDNWSQWVVLAAIVVTVIGFMIAVNPHRRDG